MGTIVVGIDGSESANRALEWAAEEAMRRAATLRLIHSWHLPPPTLGIDGGYVPPHSDAGSKEVFAGAKTLVASHVAVETEIVNEAAGRALVMASEGAELVVVGARGLGGVRESLLGSVSEHVARHARCPTVIVRIA